MDRAFASKFAKCVFLVVSGLFVLMGIGSRMFTHIDLALYGYMVGTVVFICGFFYRFIAWGERPPTKIILEKGLEKIRISEEQDYMQLYMSEHQFLAIPLRGEEYMSLDSTAQGTILRSSDIAAQLVYKVHFGS